MLVAAFAIGTGLNGLYNGATDLPHSETTLQSIAALLNILVGITGIAAAVFVWRQHRRALASVVAWATAVVAIAVMAPRAYAEVGWPAAVGGGLATAAVVAAIVLYVRWRMRVRARGESSPVS
jgi:xanthine/uracil permease